MKIFLLVTLCHLLLFSLLLLPSSSRPHLPKPLTVRTIEVVKPIAKKEEIAACDPISTPAPPVKEIKKKASTPIPTLPPVVAKRSQEKELLSLLEESVAKLQKKASPSAEKKTEKPLKKIVLQSEGAFSASYQEKLISSLQSHLRFPEKGDVEVKMEISKEGKIASLQVVSSTSEKNRRYILETLPPLSLPSPQKGDSSSFFVTLTSN